MTVNPPTNAADEPNDGPLLVLPRGPHRLTREQVAASQRTRLMSSLTSLLAEGGYPAVTIGELARSAGVARGSFYEHFADKEACLLAAYDEFAAALVAAMTANLDDDTTWSDFIETALLGYLGALEADRVGARAFIVQMDTAGPAARRRRSQAVRAFAELIRRRHAAIRARDPSLGPLPDRAYLGFALGIREVVREELEADRGAKLTRLAPDMLTWITATVQGAR
jgi:AcrR family transcriptional regulator